MSMIYRYLALASAALLMLAMALIAWFYHHQAVRDLVSMAASHSIAIDRMLTNTVWPRHGAYLSSARDLDAEALRARPETAEIQAAIDLITEGVNILKVKIYNRDGLILFSTDPSEIGGDYAGSEAFQAAVNDGQSSSELSYKGKITRFSGEIFDRDVVETYVPNFDSAGNVIAVVELYADVTQEKAQIDRTSLRLILGLAAVFAAIYVVLVFGIMRRAIEPIRQASCRAAEIGPASTGVRLPVEGMPKEIRPLILAINEALDRLDRALDVQRRFSADAAHELLTPLAILRAQVETLEDAAAAAPLRREIDAMTEMVQQLLYLADLESQSDGANPDGTEDLHAVTADIIAALAPLAIRQRKELALSGDPGPIWVRGSQRMLASAVRNLVSNALAHTPEGTTVEACLSRDGTIRVTDAGPGVPADRREMVFERFWRGAKKSAPGAGLGLAIAKLAVETMGGRIWIEDAPGGGACFAIRMEAAAPPEAA
jgi:signal transduction histidine kinase